MESELPENVRHPINHRLNRFETRCAVLTLLMAGLIVYGSLYPFEFYLPQDSIGALRSLLSTWRAWTGRGDIIANIMLYVPLGAFAVCATNRINAVRRIAGAVLAGTALSFAMELAQYFVAFRFSSMADVYCASIGMNGDT